jgi:hypothetical protein
LAPSSASFDDARTRTTCTSFRRKLLLCSGKSGPPMTDLRPDDASQVPPPLSFRDRSPSYFLIAVSTRTNLELCVQHELAGFTSSQSGLWTYCEVRDGDFVSFLYGARIRNLYQVASREAIRNASGLPPWPDITFNKSGKTYSFPYRLHLRAIRWLDESLVRSEFAYVAENLLLRAGYAKTHFQADQTTLQAVSQIGEVRDLRASPLAMPPYETFEPRFTQSQREADGVATFALRRISCKR